MSFEQWFLLTLSTLGTAGGAVWAVVKFIIPKLVDAKITQVAYEADEQAKQREFDRKQRETELEAEKAEQVELWKQMTLLQAKVMEQNTLLVEFIIDDVKTGNEEHREDIKKVFYELKNIRNQVNNLMVIITGKYEHLSLRPEET